MNSTKVVPFSGSRLRRWRKARGWSQARLVEAFREAGGRELSTMTISNIEHGKALPRVGEVELFAQVLGIEVADLGPADQTQE